uniref:Ig-like domain-containing protein n=1 Tax=Cyprinus carpio TaxID=7962 RepID=A0A8C2F5V1_CYPCA
MLEGRLTKLLINNLVEGDAGNYTSLPITFKQELKNQEGEEGNNITLRCELSKASADVKWLKGEEVLKHGEKYQLRQIATKMELVIRKAIPEDSGVYFCVCKNTSATLRVIGNATLTVKGGNSLKHICTNFKDYFIILIITIIFFIIIYYF